MSRPLETLADDLTLGHPRRAGTLVLYETAGQMIAPAGLLL
jgi:hypothetical protein